MVDHKFFGGDPRCDLSGVIDVFPNIFVIGVSKIPLFVYWKFRPRYLHECSVSSNEYGIYRSIFDG